MRLLFLPLVALVPALALACENLDGLADRNGGASATKDGGKRDAKSGTTIEGGPVIVVPPPGDPTKPRCDKTKPFAEPQIVTAFDGSLDAKAAVLSSDELEAFFLSRPLGGGDWTLRHARRATLDTGWNVVTDTMTPKPASGLSLALSETRLYYWLLEGTTNAVAKVYVATRMSRDVPFDNGTFFATTDGRPIFVVPSNDSLYFSKIADNGGIDERIQRGTANAAGILGSAEVANIHNKGDYDSNPVANPSETAIYFASDREPAVGATDIWLARRTAKTADFSIPVHVDELATSAPEAPTWVSEDECVLLFDRSKHIFQALRPL